jgi:plasmid stability protein
MMNDLYYVYVLARPDGRPFYVGKGRSDRLNQHEREARRGHRCHKCNIVRKIWRQGGQVQRYIMLETENEQEALEYEQEVVAMYGRDTLANRTGGGKGLSGYRHRPETRARMSRIMKGRSPSPQAHEAARVWHTGRPTPEETRLKISAARKGRVVSAQTRAKLAAAQKGRTVSEKTRQAVAEGNRRRVWTPEQREAAKLRLREGKMQWLEKRTREQ